MFSKEIKSGKIFNNLNVDMKIGVIRIVGDTPLLVHNYTVRPNFFILDQKTEHDSFEEFIDSIYWIRNKPEEKTKEGFEKSIYTGARFGFPSVGLKDAAVTAGYRAGIANERCKVSSSFYIKDEYDGFVEIRGIPEIREDVVRVPGTKREFRRTRGMFKTWESTFIVPFNSKIFSFDQVVSCFNHGGSDIGIGEWRKEKGGGFGAFHVE